jgi:hypothetical protein
VHILLCSVTGASFASVLDGSVVALEAGSTEAPLCRGWTVTVTGRAFSPGDATRHVRPVGADGCEASAGGALLRLEAGLVSGHYLCHRLGRGSTHPCMSGTSQMTSTPPEGRSSTPKLPPS